MGHSRTRHHRLLPGEFSRFCRAGLYLCLARTADLVSEPHTGVAAGDGAVPPTGDGTTDAGHGDQLLRRAAGVWP